MVDECKCDFSHDMKVTRIFESPRVTKPYTEEQWREIESLGHQLDGELRAQRLPAHHGRRADLREH